MATKEQGSTVLLPPMSTLAHPSHVKTVAFSLKGNALKFDSTLSIQPYLVQLDKLPDVEQVILSGNTFGVEPAAAMAKALTNKLHLTVSGSPFRAPSLTDPFDCHRSPTSPIYSPVDSFQKYLSLSLHYAPRCSICRI